MAVMPFPRVNLIMYFLGMGVMRGDLVMRSLIPVVMAGVLGIYGLISAVIITGKLGKPNAISAFQVLEVEYLSK